MIKVIFICIVCIGSSLESITSSHANNQMEIDPNSEEIFEMIDDEMIMKCIKNGDIDSYQKAKSAGQKLSTCGSSLLHTDKLLPEFRAAVIGGGKGIGPIIKNICKEYQVSGHECLNKYLDDLKPCLNDSQILLEELIVKIIDVSWKYACQNDGLHAQKFFKNSTISCIEEVSPGLVQCVAPYLPRFRAVADPTRVVAEILANKECSAYVYTATCVVTELSKCEDKTAAHLVAGNLNETIRVSPCKEYVASFDTEPKRTVNLQSLLDAQSLQMVLINKIEELLRKVNDEREESKQLGLQNQLSLISLIEYQSNLIHKLNLNLEELLNKK